MPEIIDKELEKIARLRQTPKRIYIGLGLYNEIKNEQFEPFVADISADGRAAASVPAEETTEHKGIKLHVVETEEPDFLRIEA